MRYILALLILGIISCNPKQKNANNEDPGPTVKDEVITESVSLNSWNDSNIKELEVDGFYPKFLPSGDAIIYSTSNFQGLWLYKLNDKSKSELTDARGAGYHPVVSNESILYQVKSKKTTYESLDLNTKKSSSIAGVDNDISLETFANKNNSGMHASISKDLNGIEFYSQGKKVKSIAPAGFKNIIHASFSPNEEMILVEVSGKGGFIINQEGSIIHKLGDLDQPSWLNNDEIVYAKVKDDGMKTTSGEIYVKVLTTQEEYSISSNFSGILENPNPNKKGDQVIANSSEGKLILISKK